MSVRSCAAAIFRLPARLIWLPRVTAAVLLSVVPLPVLSAPLPRAELLPTTRVPALSAVLP
ncbi:hypothetical protein D3C79_1060990 [compost metagenome]